MHMTKDEIPIKIDAPGAEARQLHGCGFAYGAIAAEYFTMRAGVDLAPLLQGLKDDVCDSAHWGYVVEGDVVVTYRDGTTERCRKGQLFHWPPGHSVAVNDDAELVLFSPQHEHTAVMDHVLGKLAGS